MWGPEEASFSIEWRRATFAIANISPLDGTERNPGVIKFINGKRYSRRTSSLSVVADHVTVAQYWCQVNASGELLQESNRLIVVAEGLFATVASCPRSNQSTTEPKCADLDQPLQPLTQASMSTSTLQPTPSPTVTGDNNNDNGSVQQALFIVVGVIAVFAVVIVALTVTIVILYRKKVARVSFKAEGESVYTCC